MRRYLIALLAVGLAALLVAPSASFAQTADPLAVVQTFHTGLRGSASAIEAAMAVVADDMTIAILPDDSKGPSVVGKAAVREFLDGLQKENFALDTADYKAAGGKVTFTYTGRKDGKVQFTGSAEASVQNGKISSIVYTDNPAPQALPQTGAAGFLELTWLLALAGLSAIAVGLALRRHAARRPGALS